MESFEPTLVPQTCTEAGKARVATAKAEAMAMAAPGVRIAKLSATSSTANESDEINPTKELNAMVLGNTLVGYGDTISLENMTIIDNLIKYSKLEADQKSKDSTDPATWHCEFLQCMDDMGCSIPISSSVQFSKRKVSGTMKNVVTTIVKAGVDAAKAAIPGATVLSAVADSTIAALGKDPEIINVFNYEVTKTTGVKLAILPCEQAKNGLIIISCSSVNYDGDKVGGGVLFFDLQVSSLDIYQGSNFIVFNPAAYAEVKQDIEYILKQNRKNILAKRFPRRLA